MTRSVVLLIALYLLSACAHQAGLTSKQIDELAVSAMREFHVPGAAIGVIKDGKVVHAAGYGLREQGFADPVDTKTLFRVASTTKAITAASLAMLADGGKLSWDDKVVDHMPGFQLYDPWITQHFTVTDLLTHRSGLAPYSGDLMLWPRPNSFTREDILHGLRYFEPAKEFRTGYDYDNLLYIVAGELVPAVTGQQWQDFVDEHILGRLGTTRCFAGRIPENQMVNLAVPHAMVEDSMQVIERNRVAAQTAVAAAAGGVRCSLDDMLKWVRLQLARGQLPDGSRLFSERQSAAMWSPKTIRSVSPEETERDGTHFKSYGLGWHLVDVHGYKQVHHTGSFTGFNTSIVLIPELDLAAIVMLNASAGSARTAIVNAIIRPYLGQRGIDWVEYYLAREVAEAASNEGVVVIAYAQGSVSGELSSYVGTYNDPWFGDVSVTLVEDELWFAAAKSPKLSGRLWPQQEHTFVLRWQDRTAERDVFVDFVDDGTGEFINIQVRCLSEQIQCAFEDQDMNFRRTSGD